MQKKTEGKHPSAPFPRASRRDRFNTTLVLLVAISLLGGFEFLNPFRASGIGTSGGTVGTIVKWVGTGSTNVYGEGTPGRVAKWFGTFAPSVSVTGFTLTPNPDGKRAPVNDVTLSASISGTAAGPATYTFDCNTSVAGTRPSITPTAGQETSATDTGACDYATSGVYGASVSVTRAGATATRSVNFTVGLAPTANAGPDQPVGQGATVTLNGSGSDADGDTPLTYVWTQTAGPTITLSSATIQNPTFTFPRQETTLTFSLVVTDSSGRPSAPDTVDITAGNGTIRIKAKLDGADWPLTGTESIVMDVSHNVLGTFQDVDVSAPGDYTPLPTGDFTLRYKSGGPTGKILRDITPGWSATENSSTQTLTNQGIITFTFNFATPDRPPVAVAGVSVGTVSPRIYTDNLKVKQGIPLTLHFAPYIGKFGQTPSQIASMSADQDDAEGFPANGILNGGVCEWNDNLSVDPNDSNRFDTQIDKTTAVGDKFPFDSRDASKDCITSATHNFNDIGGTYKVFRLTDKPGALSNVAGVTITAVPAPVITSFTATPNPINQDQAFTLAWASTGTASCSSPDTGFNTAIAGRTSGSAMISDLRTSPKNYVLNCISTDTDLYPDPATDSKTVTINQCVATLTPSRTSVQSPGDPITLAWSATNARSCSVAGVAPAPICSTDAICRAGGTTGNIVITSARTFTLSCTGDAGACSATTPTVSVANQAPTPKVGASTDTSFGRAYSNTITVTQNVTADIYVSAGPTIDGAAGSSDSDGSLVRCDWNTDFVRSPPISYENNNAISPPGDIGDCDRTIAGRIFTDPPTVPGTPNIYPLLRVTDNEGATADETLRVNILPNLAVSLTATPVSDNAPFSPTLRADITAYTGAASDTGNFSIWWDCTNTSSNIGVVSATTACGPLPSEPSGASGDRICTKNANGAKCDGVPLQGQEFLTTVVDPAYSARATAYSPKVIVERGAARSAEARASVTATTPFAYTLTKTGTGGDIDVVKGSSGTTAIAFDHTAGAAQSVSFSASGLPAGAVASFVPPNCTSDCTTTMTISTTASTPAGGSPTTTVVSGSVAGGAPASVGLTVRDTLSCAPTTQTAVVGVQTGSITAAGGTGTNLWEVFHPSNLLTRDPNASPNTGSGATFSTTFNTTGTGRIIRVTSGTQTAQCAADVVGQTLTAAISAVPNTGTAPLASTITGQITSGSTAVGTINYSFWWDCANDGANVTNVINGTGSGVSGAIACSNPEGATANLATNYPSITCKGNAVGAKCFVDPGAVPAAEAFNPITKPLQVVHSYAGNTTPYIPKVIIERGSAPAAEARASVTATFPALTASCSAAPTDAITGVNITWTAIPGGGSGTYSYAWTGDVPLQGRTGNPAVVSYSTAGAKNGSVTVTDSSGATRTASCTNSVAISLPPNGAPVAVAGISKDTSSSRAYTPSVDVKFGVSTPLYFSAFIGTKISPTAGQVSNDPDGWTTAEGVSNGGHCDWNVELSQASPPAYPNNRITSPASPTACEASRPNPVSSPHTFNDLPQNDAQISRTLSYNILQITDNRATVSNDGQASVIVHYQPMASLTVNGGATATVNSEDPVVIAWSSTHASSCTGAAIPGFPVSNPPSGSVTVNPTASANYSVSCSGSPLWPAASASASVVVRIPFTFTLAKERDISVVQGATTGNTSVITATKTGGAGAPVSFSAGGLPAGASATFTPVTCTPNTGSPPICTTVMSITTTRGAGATPVGAYPISVIGSSTSFTSPATTLTLTVNSRISASIFSTPVTGFAPLDAKWTAEATDYTGNPADPLIYTFWWDCNKLGTDIAALSGATTTPGGCGDPSDIAIGIIFPGEPGATKDTPVHLYATPATYTGKVVIARGAAKDQARAEIVVQNAGGAPVAKVKISADPNADREYFDAITVKKGEPTHLFLAADDGTGAPNASFDPDGWTSANGVSGTGKCEWNSALVQTLPVPFAATVSSPPSAGACNIDIGVKTFNDAPGVYTYDVLRIMDNKGLPSNIARVKITVSPELVNQNPVSVVRGSTNTNATRQYFDEITVQRNVSTPIYLAADDGTSNGSYDPDGWTSANGVSASGKCQWNSALSTDLPVPFSTNIATPASAAECNTFIGTKTFSDPVGQYVFDVLRITDNKGLRSNIARIQINVAETIIVNNPPVAAVRISTNPNADRTYADSVTVQRNVSTPIYLAADDGTGAPNASFDPDGWTSENGVAGNGKCEWNSALSQALPVPFATAFNQPANPAECNVFIGAKTFNDAPGIYTYDVLRITDNKGLKSNIARTRITVEETIVVNNPPVAAAKVSTDLNFDRQYFDSVSVMRGQPTPVYLSADDGTAEKSFDPDGWASENGVSQTGKCEWNSALSQQDPVPFGKQFAAPGSAAQCNTSLGNITFNDAPGTYTYGVLRITDNKGYASNVATIQIMISNAPPGPSNSSPIARAQVSTDPNFGRTYFDSVAVQRGVATQIYGSAALSSDSDGWGTPQRGVSSGGKCEWNRDLSQDDPVSFESPAIQNPDAPADCNALLGTFTFNDAAGTYTYGALRITDAGGLKSVVAPITITVSTQPPGPGNNAPVARARISKNRNFGRIYTDTLAVVRGELTPIYVAADDGSSTSTVSFDPDGWTSANGVSAGGKCEWNRDLSQDDPVSFESPAVASPQGANDCNIFLGDFTFNDDPGEYVYGMLRITDNKGLKSNVAPITITVAETHAPVAVAGISKDASFDRAYQPLIEVAQGVATPIFIAAIEGTLQAPTRQSLDPDGWANNANGVSNGGKCEWNRNLVLAEPEFVNPPTLNPPTPADCRVSLGNRTFSNSPGIYAFGALKITDKSSLASNIAIVRIRVGLPELTVAPPQLASGALVEGGSVTFSDIVRNSGTITAEGSIANRFQVDINNDGTINLTLGNPTVQNLATGGQAGVDSTSWNNLPLGTHRVIFSTNTDGSVIESNSGNNTAQTIITVSSQQLSVGLSADPASATTTLPTTITATVPGAPAAPINYSFWWNCSDPTNNVSVAASSCGALPLPVPGQCVSNDTGAKCDSIEALSQQVIHTYAVPGTFTPKVIVERGTQSPAESRTQVTVTTNPTGGQLTVSCSVSPTSVSAGNVVTWSAFPQGGSGPYGFTWGGDAPLADKTGNPVNVNYGSTGVKAGSIVVTSGPETALRNCGTVNVSPGITAFTTASSTLTPGATTTLSWSTVGFTSCTLDKGGGPQSVPTSCTAESCPAGVNQIAPTQTTTYTLVCAATSPSGSSDTKVLIIRVLSQPSTQEIVPE